MFKATHILVGTALGVSLLVQALSASATTARPRALTAGLVQSGGNTLSGFVFGGQRLPVADINVELLDEFNRTLDRARTNGSGSYYFARLGPGRYRVRVLAFETIYAEQTQEVEIINMARRTGDGGVQITGRESAQLDFYLRPRASAVANVSTGANSVVFAQAVPEEARKTFEQGVADLRENREASGLNALKRSIELFPEYYAALDRLGTEYIMRRHYLAAAILLNQAVKVNQRAHTSYYSLGYSLYNLNRKREAIESLKRAVNLNAASVNAPILLGRTLREVGKYDDAERQLKRAKELAKGIASEVNWQLALLYGNNLKRYTEAADELELFLKAQPESRDTASIRKLITTFRDKARTSGK
ncbi:MAG: CDC27 family protein [Pyrinomonadaceae bacterium]